MPSLPPRAALTAVLAASAVAASAALVPPAIASTTASRATPNTVTLARGVTLTHRSTEIGGRSQQLQLLDVDLSRPGVRVDTASPRGVVGAQRQSVAAMTNARHALAGVNADFFDLDNDDASPRGVLVTSGRLMKSSGTERNANLVIRRTDKGTYSAAVGPLPVTGHVLRTRKGARNASRDLSTVNSLFSARAGGLVLLTSALAPSDIGKSCTLATGAISRGVWTVRTVRSHISSTPTFTASSFGLLSCQGNGRSWIVSSLRAGDRLTVAQSVAHGTPYAAIGGGSVLVRNGKAWKDPLGEQLPYPGPNAETFACIGRQGTALTLGTIDGYTRASAGVTYRQLAGYLVQMGCWSGLVLDGGGSTTMVAKLPGTSRATVQNVPADNPPRHIADSIVVFG